MRGKMPQANGVINGFESFFKSGKLARRPGFNPELRPDMRPRVQPVTPNYLSPSVSQGAYSPVGGMFAFWGFFLLGSFCSISVFDVLETTFGHKHYDRCWVQMACYGWAIHVAAVILFYAIYVAWIRRLRVAVRSNIILGFALGLSAVILQFLTPRVICRLEGL